MTASKETATNLLTLTPSRATNILLQVNNVKEINVYLTTWSLVMKVL